MKAIRWAGGPATVIWLLIFGLAEVLTGCTVVPAGASHNVGAVEPQAVPAPVRRTLVNQLPGGDFYWTAHRTWRGKAVFVALAYYQHQRYEFLVTPQGRLATMLILNPVAARQRELYREEIILGDPLQRQIEGADSALLRVQTHQPPPP